MPLPLERRRPCPHRVDPRRRRLLIAGLVAALPVRASHADVVPPEAVDVAQAWLALVDRGRDRDAVTKYFDANSPAAARAMAVQLGKIGPRARVARRTMTAWAGHGEGDMSRMAPGSYFAMVFDVVDAAGRTGSDEVRLIPLGDAWRVVGYVRVR